MVLEEMSYSVANGERVRELLDETQRQTPEGVFWHRGHLVFVGRKPSTLKNSESTVDSAMRIVNGL